jgi:hypothetical protein
MQMEKLVPFTFHWESIDVRAGMTARGSRLHFFYELLDPQHQVLDSFVPGERRGEEVGRADLLWKTTCLEAFWSPPGKKSYWELNVAPKGDRWNLYFFEDYRTPFPPEACFDYKLESIKVTPTSLQCDLSGGPELLALDHSLCVILRTDKAMHFYAEQHLSAEPDFHSRRSFTPLALGSGLSGETARREAHF